MQERRPSASTTPATTSTTDTGAEPSGAQRLVQRKIQQRAVLRQKQEDRSETHGHGAAEKHHQSGTDQVVNTGLVKAAQGAQLPQAPTQLPQITSVTGIEDGGEYAHPMWNSIWFQVAGDPSSAGKVEIEPFLADNPANYGHNELPYKLDETGQAQVKFSSPFACLSIGSYGIRVWVTNAVGESPIRTLKFSIVN